MMMATFGEKTRMGFPPGPFMISLLQPAPSTESCWRSWAATVERPFWGRPETCWVWPEALVRVRAMGMAAKST